MWRPGAGSRWRALPFVALVALPTVDGALLRSAGHAGLATGRRGAGTGARAPVLPASSGLSQQACDALREGIVFGPAACEYRHFRVGEELCSCTIQFPASVKPVPTSIADSEGDGSVPPFPALPVLERPSLGDEAYEAPTTVPQCPYHAECGAAGDLCLDFRSWGFREVRPTQYTPASAHANTVTCNYFAEPGRPFSIPEKVQALQHMRARMRAVREHYSEVPLRVACGAAGNGTWADFCTQKLERERFACDMPWRWLWTATCATSPLPPPKFKEESTLQQLCPLDCGFEPGAVRWP